VTGAPNILLVSNGFGEAAIAGYLARAIAVQSPDAVVEHMPLVGGKSRTGVPHTAPSTPVQVGPVADMPSGGLVAYGNLANLRRDVSAGLLGLTLRQFGFLRRQRARDAVVAVGDVYCLAACSFFARRPTVFVATAKSQHVAPHSGLERAIARGARVVFTRDEATAQALRADGVRAEYAGNLMMDGLEPELELPVRADAVRLGVLPGSRADAPDNAAAAMRRVKLVAGMLQGRAVQAFLAIAPSVDARAIMDACAGAGVTLAPTGQQSGVIARGHDGDLEVLAVSGAFGDVLRASTIVLGQAGTGNEQAAGLGRPVIAWAENSTGRTGWYRMRQQRLLGDALLVLPRQDQEYAAGIVALLDDPQRMNGMARLGKERMGEPGGAAVVAKAVLSQASHKSV
jgi:uncharacterized protein (TIGR03492 family)